MQKVLRIKNLYGEEINTLVENNESVDTTIVFIHGFGTDKHENAHYFDDLSSALKNNFRIVRFDFSGCGKSQGKFEEKDYQKWAEDLNTVLEWVKDEYSGKIYILAQSMGTFVTSLLSPDGIEKTVFTGIPNSDTAFIVKRLSKRILSRPGGTFNESGISIFPRSSGEVQKIGPGFWKTLRLFNPQEAVRNYAGKSKLIVFKPLQDEVVGSEFLKEYQSIPNLEWVELPGNHSWKNNKDRKELINRITRFFTMNSEFCQASTRL